jgi:hypothetical protein
MTKLGSNAPRRALKPDAQAFDEIRIVTIPRYKTSGLSGDEWRISARIQFYRKGKLVRDIDHFNNIETACGFMYSAYHAAIGNGDAYFAGEDNICDQEGCHEQATVTYKLKKEFCRAGHETNPYEHDTRPLVRKFCIRHSKRGDCALEDADRNYEILEGQTAEPQPNDVKPSIFGGTIAFDPTQES